MLIPEKAQIIFQLLSNAGYECFLVGGCVRDMLMGKEPHDIDITTNALPEETKAVFSAFHTLDIGIKHGTITVIIDGEPIEITTYRTESEYTDGRHPDRVTFTANIKDDLSRRDFTCNAIAYNPAVGLVDPFGGMADIESKTLRCVGIAEERFREDSLRILRALRFASCLGFDIEDDTAKAMYTCRELINIVSPERIYTEISKLICGKNAGEIISLYSDILAVPLPEIKDMKGFQQHNFHHIYDVLNHTAKVVDSVSPAATLRLAALFHDCGKPDCFSIDENGVGHFYSHASISARKANEALLRLRCDNATREKVVKLVKIHDSPIEPDSKTVKKKLQKYGEEIFFDLIKLQRADNKGLSPEFLYRQETYDKLEEIARQVIEENQCFSLKDLAVNGRDMIDLGLKGKDIGLALDLLLKAVIEEQCQNDRESLLIYYHRNVKSV
ncbi:MAG: HD domain-containing protein [Clostridia bacterium]|nr:HD domain-containing protein [Clostridia bacterium]